MLFRSWRRGLAAGSGGQPIAAAGDSITVMTLGRPHPDNRNREDTTTEVMVKAVIQLAPKSRSLRLQTRSLGRSGNQPFQDYVAPHRFIAFGITATDECAHEVLYHDLMGRRSSVLR